MPCYHPLKGYFSDSVNPTGKRSIVFSGAGASGSRPISVPCGQCIGCRLDRSRMWAVRCLHEASLHDENCFITLTFDDDHLPSGGSLDGKLFQDFMKRLRKMFITKPKKFMCFRRYSKIRFFHCGEYGETTRRPHHHALLFGFDFPDKYLWRRNDQGHSIWRSDILDSLWPYGFSEIGSVDFDSAAYVARYCTKKITGEISEEFYSDMDLETGYVTQRKSEFVTMSRKPGIASDWYDQFASDVFPSDFVVLPGGVKVSPPKYYSKKFEIDSPKVFANIRRKRVVRAGKSPDNAFDRLAVREICKLEKFKQLKRSL